MKVLLFSGILFLFAVLYAEAWPVDDQIIKECQKELGVPEDNTDESKLRCMGLCLLKKTGVLESDRKVNIDKMKENMAAAVGKEQVDEYLKKILECMAEAKSIEDECDYVNTVTKCSNVN